MTATHDTDHDRDDVLAFQASGDRQRLVALWTRHAAAAGALARRIAGAHAEDALQEAAMALVAAAASWRDRGPGSARAWFFAVIANQARKHVRRMTRREVRLVDVAPTLATPPPAIEDGAAFDALRRLPDRYRLAVELRVVDQLEFAAVAGALGVPERTARTRVARGLQRLRAALGVRDATALSALPLLIAPTHAMPPPTIDAGRLIAAAPAAQAPLLALPVAAALVAATLVTGVGIAWHRRASEPAPVIAADATSPPARDAIAQLLAREVPAPCSFPLWDHPQAIARWIDATLDPTLREHPVVGYGFIGLHRRRPDGSAPWLADARPRWSVRDALDAWASATGGRWRVEGQRLVTERDLPRALRAQLDEAWSSPDPQWSVDAARRLFASGDRAAQIAVVAACADSGPRGDAARVVLGAIGEHPDRIGLAALRGDSDAIAATTAALAGPAQGRDRESIAIMAAAVGDPQAFAALMALLPDQIPWTRRRHGLMAALGDIDSEEARAAIAAHVVDDLALRDVFAAMERAGDPSFAAQTREEAGQGLGVDVDVVVRLTRRLALDLAAGTGFLEAWRAAADEAARHDPRFAAVGAAVDARVAAGAALAEAMAEHQDWFPESYVEQVRRGEAEHRLDARLQDSAENLGSAWGDELRAAAVRAASRCQPDGDRAWLWRLVQPDVIAALPRTALAGAQMIARDGDDASRRRLCDLIIADAEHGRRPFAQAIPALIRRTPDAAAALLRVFAPTDVEDGQTLGVDHVGWRSWEDQAALALLDPATRARLVAPAIAVARRWIAGSHDDDASTAMCTLGQFAAAGDASARMTLDDIAQRLDAARAADAGATVGAAIAVARSGDPACVAHALDAGAADADHGRLRTVLSWGLARTPPTAEGGRTNFVLLERLHGLGDDGVVLVAAAGPAANPAIAALQDAFMQNADPLTRCVARVSLWSRDPLAFARRSAALAAAAADEADVSRWSAAMRAPLYDASAPGDAAAGLELVLRLLHDDSAAVRRVAARALDSNPSRFDCNLCDDGSLAGFTLVGAGGDDRAAIVFAPKDALGDLQARIADALADRALHDESPSVRYLSARSAFGWSPRRARALAAALVAERGRAWLDGFFDRKAWERSLQNPPDEDAIFAPRRDPSAPANDF